MRVGGVEMWWTPNRWPWGSTAASLSRREELEMPGLVVVAPRLGADGVADDMVNKAAGR